MLMNFGEPDSNNPCARRAHSNTQLQALNLLNDPVFFAAAQALAYRVVNEIPGDASARIDGAFERCLARKPSPHEKERLLQYFNQQNPHSTEAAAWVSVS